MNTRQLLYSLLLVSLIGISINAFSSENKGPGSDDKTHEYINSTENLKQSNDRFENSTTYEVFFTLDQTVDCISVSLETAAIPKKFFEESSQVKSYFVVEKILEVDEGTAKKQKIYIQSGKNYNTNWEVHNPVKICAGTADPAARLGGSVFRVRFTTFNTKPVYFTLTVYTPAGVNFGTDPAQLLQVK